MEKLVIGLYVIIGLAIVAAVAAIVVVFKRLSKGGSAVDGGSVVDKDELYKAVSDAVKLENAMVAGAVNAQAAQISEINNRMDRFTTSVGERLDVLRKELVTSDSSIKAETIANMNAFKESVIEAVHQLKEGVTNSLAAMSESTNRTLIEMRESNAKALKEVQADNAKQLELMRETVDEKLSSTLEKRFDASFKLVGEKLEAIVKTFAELQNLQSGVNDLNRILKNVKTRGTWGEVSLESLLSQILTSEQYEKQKRLSKNSDEAVDFVIKLPGNGSGEILLPIDAKFPTEEYIRLSDAADAGDKDAVADASKRLAAAVKKQAADIQSKYLKPNVTTDFAIMYLPTEGLYAEVVRRSGLIEEIQNKYHIIPCGPTTIAALLNSLQMGFKSLTFEKRSTEIINLLNSFTHDFNLFTQLLEQTGQKLGRVQDSIAKAEKRTEIIKKKLNKVSKYSPDGAAPSEPVQLDENGDIIFDLNDTDDEG